jgi:hypothetical protein
VADRDPVTAVYVVVYLDEVPGPFNRDVNVKGPAPPPLRSACERYERFYIRVSVRVLSAGLPAPVPRRPEEMHVMHPGCRGGEREREREEK